jgi:hypothetical protein
MAYANIGNALGELGRTEEELEYHKKSLEISQQTGDVVGEGNTHYNISCAFEDSGGMKGAIEHMQQAHTCFVRCFGAEHSEAGDAQEQVERLEALSSA